MSNDGFLSDQDDPYQIKRDKVIEMAELFDRQEKEIEDLKQCLMRAKVAVDDNKALIESLQALLDSERERNKLLQEDRDRMVEQMAHYNVLFHSFYIQLEQFNFPLKNLPKQHQNPEQDPDGEAEFKQFMEYGERKKRKVKIKDHPSDEEMEKIAKSLKADIGCAMTGRIVSTKPFTEVVGKNETVNVTADPIEAPK